MAIIKSNDMTVISREYLTAIDWAMGICFFTPHEKMVLVALAFGSENAICTATMSDLSETSGMSKSCVIRALKSLEQSGRIEKVAASEPHLPNSYILKVG